MIIINPPNIFSKKSNSSSKPVRGRPVRFQKKICGFQNNS